LGSLKAKEELCLSLKPKGNYFCKLFSYKKHKNVLGSYSQKIRRR